MPTPPDTRPPEDDLDRERVYTDQDPARPGGKGNAMSLVAFSFAFLLILVVFFYARQGC